MTPVPVRSRKRKDKEADPLHAAGLAPLDRCGADRAEDSGTDHCGESQIWRRADERAISIILAMALCLSLAAVTFAENGADEVDYTTGTPWMDIDLEGNVTADTPTDPKDNFALWVNKDRILSMEIRQGFLAAGNTVDVNIKGTEDMKALFHGEVPEDHDAKLAYDYFYLLCDWDARDARGVAPLKEMVDAVEGITSLEALTEYFVKTPWENRLYCLWKESSVQDTENPGANVLSIKDGYRLIRDPAEYIQLTDDGQTRKKPMKSFSGKCWKSSDTAKRKRSRNSITVLHGRRC